MRVPAATLSNNQWGAQCTTKDTYDDSHIEYSHHTVTSTATTTQSLSDFHSHWQTAPTRKTTGSYNAKLSAAGPVMQLSSNLSMSDTV